MYPKDHLVLFGSEGAALTLPLFLLSLFMFCHCSSQMTKDHFLVISYGTIWPDVLLSAYSFIHSFIHEFIHSFIDIVLLSVSLLRNLFPSIWSFLPFNFR